MEPIIKFRTDTDYYKFTMCQCFKDAFPNEVTEWEFKLRTKDVKLGYLTDEVNNQFDMLCDLKFTDQELAYLAQNKFMTDGFVDWLRDETLKRRQIVCTDSYDQIEIRAKGPDIDSTWFEIHVMQIIQELYMKDKPVDLEKSKARTMETIEKFNEAKDSGLEFTVSDFGARRRYSFDWHDWVVGMFVRYCKAFIGTSDVYLAMKHNTKCIGTFAHQGYAITQGLKNVPIRNSQTCLWDAWTKFYRGNLGIALSDNFGFKAFTDDFDLYYAKLFDGCRHDSGDPFVWGEQLIRLYEKLGIDPRTKIACWSDSLDVDKAIEIARYFNGKIKVSFGIGTFLTNNMVDSNGNVIKPLSMVMKVVKTNGRDVVKLSDAPGKIMCQNQDYIDYVKKTFDYIPLDQWEGIK